jgi:hypothetical protein
MFRDINNVNRCTHPYFNMSSPPEKHNVQVAEATLPTPPIEVKCKYCHVHYQEHRIHTHQEKCRVSNNVIRRYITTTKQLSPKIAARTTRTSGQSLNAFYDRYAEYEIDEMVDEHYTFEHLRDADEICAICHCPMMRRICLELNNCSHTFCLACIRQWYAICQDCPLCKRPM